MASTGTEKDPRTGSLPIMSQAEQDQKASGQHELSPEQRQSVLGTLRSPRRLKTEVLAGLVVALALIPEAIAF